MLDNLKRLAANAAKLIDTAHEAAHAVSACVELARETNAIRQESAEVLREELRELREQYHQVDGNLAATETERDQLRAELERVKLALAKATEERNAARRDLDMAVERNIAITDNLKPLVDFAQEFTGCATANAECRDLFMRMARDMAKELDTLAHKIDWLTRWRDTPCPFPAKTWVLARDADGDERGSYANLTHSLVWRPATLDLYEEFRDA